MIAFALSALVLMLAWSAVRDGLWRRGERHKTD